MIDGECYLSGFLACWLSRRVFPDAPTSIRQEAFLMTVEMARVKLYSQAIPNLAWAYRALEEFRGMFEQVKRNYGPWALVLGWLGAYFPRHSSYTLQTCFIPLSYPVQCLSLRWNVRIPLSFSGY